MKELSLHMLDIAQNSIAAGARSVDLTVEELGGLLTLVVQDNGKGMSPEFLAQVTDPFTTTRTTRKVGLGLPLLRLAAEMTGGRLEIRSQLGKGTTVTASFHQDHIDCPPLGDMAGTVSLLVQGLPEGMELTYLRRGPAGAFCFDTRQVREILGPDVPLSAPDVCEWVRGHVEEGEQSVAPTDRNI